MGTSAATCVALLGALQFLRSGAVNAREIAHPAHRVETELLGQQSGVQDQLAAAYGGISFIEMDCYPHATRHRVMISDAMRRELERRLSLVFVGQSHHSSAVHKMVIRQLEGAGRDAPQLARLRALAERARDALLAGDLHEFGKLMIANTEAPSELHPELVGWKHRRIIEIARRRGAWGWKVNGAGGSGGSVTILHGPDDRRRQQTLRLIREADPSFHGISIRLDDVGLRVREQPCHRGRRRRDKAGPAVAAAVVS